MRQKFCVDIDNALPALETANMHAVDAFVLPKNFFKLKNLVAVTSFDGNFDA